MLVTLFVYMHFFLHGEFVFCFLLVTLWVDMRCVCGYDGSFTCIYCL